MDKKEIFQKLKEALEKVGESIKKEEPKVIDLKSLNPSN